ncbi:YgeY family selenium metabolism-linked hydrolase [Gordonia paraffinivorans]|uniref:YgeY family selenium metabolism-linked hydrolase n=1 Tax=Gordonia paraffinivorans TaxID=175628 RepID=UPI001444C1E1|nr:YgeY family selenium metabolism-linked hydrolase [Gordonia paraffinivorans]
MTAPAYEIDEASLIEFLTRYIAARSYSSEEADAAKLLIAEMEKLGFGVEVDEWGNVIGTMRLGEGPTVLIDCHMDTVVVTDESVWEHNPWGEIADDGRMYGRGTADMKGPTASALYGLAALKDRRVGTLVLSGTIAEELAEGPALAKVCERVEPDFVITAESTNLRLNHGQRGRGEVLVSVHGKSSHSAHPTAGINAAQVMADVIVALRDVPVPHQAELGDGILVLTDIISRPYPGLSVQPDLCQATFDRRLLVGETEENVLGPIREIVDEICAKHGTTGTVEIAYDDFTTYNGTHVRFPNFAPAWLTDPQSALVTEAKAALEAVGLPSELGTYKFCTNASASAGRLGIPSIGYGPGEEDQAHTVDESIVVADLGRAALGFAAIVDSILTSSGAGE